MRKFKYDYYLFLNKNNKKIPSLVKPNLSLIPIFLKNKVKVYNGLNNYTIEEVQKKHLNSKIGTFINTRSTKKKS